MGYQQAFRSCSLTSLVLSTKLGFFTQVSTGCEQIAVGKNPKDFFGKLGWKTEVS